MTESLPDAADRRRVRAPKENEASVALLVRVGQAVALLGADLQNHAAEDRGWKAVLGSHGRPRERASLFKIAHHGADNADNPHVWRDMVDDDVVATVTPYGSGPRPRPDDADVARICAYTSEAYIAGPRHVTLPRASRPVEKIRRRAVKSAVVSERPLGHVRCRRSVHATAWTVELYGTAERLCSTGPRSAAPVPREQERTPPPRG